MITSVGGLSSWHPILWIASQKLTAKIDLQLLVPVTAKPRSKGVPNLSRQRDLLREIREALHQALPAAWHGRRVPATCEACIRDSCHLWWPIVKVCKSVEHEFHMSPLVNLSCSSFVDKTWEVSLRILWCDWHNDLKCISSKTIHLICTSQLLISLTLFIYI